jgi:type IV pilus assembly protein PilB
VSDLVVTEQELRDVFVARLELLTPAAFDDICDTARRLRLPLERAIRERANLPAEFLHEQLADAWNVAFTELRVGEIKLDALRRIRPDVAQRRMVAAFDVAGNVLRVAAANPRDAGLASELRQLTSSDVELVLATSSAIRRAHLLYAPWLSTALARPHDSIPVPLTTDPGRPEPSPAELADRILEFAVITNASDIHLEPYEWECLVRYRIDGVLTDVFSVTPHAYPQLAARIKVMSGMRVDEKRAPQDGRFGQTSGGADIDLRVSSVPTHWGEKIVLRVLAKEVVSIGIEDMGLAADDYQRLRHGLQRPFGMILVTGPTGSGKTTTLYATLARLGAERRGRVNICTIEDPVERLMPRVTQIAVNPAAGIDFAGGLRALLRQDPDVIMVGEIRDRETAEIAVRAALVGRLLFATLHTNDAAGAVARLTDMGVEPYLLASTLELVVAQRLVRRICVDCRESTGLESPAFRAVQATPAFAAAVPVLQRRGVLSSAESPLGRVRLYRGRGCLRCSGSGYRGRLGVFELLQVNDPIRGHILDRRCAAATIRAAAIAHGMTTMFEDALTKVFLGETSIDEAVRATA